MHCKLQRYSLITVLPAHKTLYQYTKEISNLVSVGDKMYFASQVVAVVNNELDYRGI